MTNTVSIFDYAAFDVEDFRSYINMQLTANTSVFQ